MGAIGGLIGTAGGASGTGFSGPQNAYIDKPATVGQANAAQADVNTGLSQQQSLLQALQGQNGIGNQNAAFNQTNKLSGQLAKANGVNNQSEALWAQQALANQQQGTAQQYQNIANGTGPNPAQIALQNATGQNVANQAALMAGQRGAGANVGLLARQAAQQGAGIQQQAVGQSAEMQAQQQLAGLQGLAQQQQAIGNTNQNVAGIAGQQIGAQQAQQQALAAQAAAQVANQMGATTGFSQAAQSAQNNILGGINAQNSASVGNQGNINNANASMANTKMGGQSSIVGGVGQAVGAIAGLAEGGPVAAPLPVGPSSSFGQFLSGWSSGQGGYQGIDPGSIMDSGVSDQDLQNGMAKAGQGISGLMNKPGAGQNMAGPDASAMSSIAMTAAKGGLAGSGGQVAAKSPDQKAVKSGNSYDNDKIPAMLSEQEIVIPRSVTLSKDPINNAAKFVAAVMAKRRSGK